jgi:hypothetical protein
MAQSLEVNCDVKLGYLQMRNDPHTDTILENVKSAVFVLPLLIRALPNAP